MQTGERDSAKLAEHLIHTIGGQMPEYLFLALYTVTEHRKNRERNHLKNPVLR